MAKQPPKNQQRGKLRWYFPSTDHGENNGFADSQLQHFEGDHEKYIARETIQNAVDARLDYGVPVTVVFERINMPGELFPGRDELIKISGRCLSFLGSDEKPKEFFQEAAALLKSKNIPILKISDFNTKGLSGSDDDVAGNWYRLVKASGTSSPKGVKGGSFGIGKGAPIAASALRTVFYSSINERGEQVFQGKARLVSHHDEEGDVRQGVGFYGVDGYMAVRESGLVPDLFKRTEQGTDIFVMGYKSGSGWEQKLIKSVLDNFWLAIYQGQLEVTVRDGSEINITKGSLEKCFDAFDAQDAKFFFEAFINPTQTFEAEDLKYLGKVTLCIRKGDEFPSPGKVMMVRKPKMFVQDKKFRALREPYAGVVICEDDRGNELLRDLEPPAHDKWDKDRSPKGQAALRELETFINQSLKSMGDSLTSEPQDIPGLDRYLPDSEERDYLPSAIGEAFEETGLSSDEESGREVGAEKTSASDVETVVRTSSVTNKQLSNIKPSQPQGGHGGASRGKKAGSDEGEKEGMRISTSSISFRSFIQNGANGLEYHLAITGRDDCEGGIRIVAVGDDGSYPVELESATDVRSGKQYETGNSMIKGMAIEKGKTIKIAVRLSSKKRYTLGIENYEG